MIMTTITWLQIFAAIFQLITSTSGACSDTNVGISDELRVIPDSQMNASSENGPSFSAEFGRLHGTNAWCPDPGEMVVDGPYLQINLSQTYDICGVQAQGEPGASVTTSFTLSYSVDGILPFTNFNSGEQFDGDDFKDLSSNITAQFIRFHPVNTSICLRVEVYGTPDGVDVTCNETDIQVRIDQSIEGSGSGLGIPTLIDSSETTCQAADDGSFFTFDFTLGICGTTILISNDGDTAFYRNTITTADDTQFEIICPYMRTRTFLGEGSGDINFAMGIFTDDAFTMRATDTISLRTKLHFRIEVDTSGTEVHLINCRATNSSDPDDSAAAEYKIIENGCNVASDSIVTGYDCAETTNTQTFDLDVFRFAGSTTGESIYFHCLAAVCSRSNTNSICTTQCNDCSTGSKRKKRDLGDHSRNDLAEENLVLGPYQIIDNDDDNDVVVDGRTKGEDPSETVDDSNNFPIAMVIIVCIGALAAIAIIIVFFVTLRLSQSSRGPAVKNVTVALARDNMAFDELDVKALSMKT